MKKSALFLFPCLLLFLAGCIGDYERGYQDGLDAGKALGRQEIDVKGIHDAGYQEGLVAAEKKGVCYDFPTYDQVISFLAEDNTDNLTFSSRFNCVDFSTRLVANAHAKGFVCYGVVLNFLSPCGDHVIVAFDTDRGIIFVDPQSDKVVPVEVGGKFRLGLVDCVVSQVGVFK